jgi:ankyrin repeat protein
MLSLLVTTGAAIERQHFLGTTALHWAAMRGQLDVIDRLIELGADVNRVGRKFSAAGHTPLELAVERDRRGAAELLRARGGRVREA